MSNCDHTIGFEYGEEYGSSSGNIINLSDLKFDLSYAKKLNNEDDIQKCKFCPDCSIELAPIIESTIKKRKSEIKKSQKEKEAKKRKDNALFNKKKTVVAKQTKLDTLDQDKSYYVSFKVIKYGKDANVVLTGNPDHIATNIIHYFRGEVKEDIRLTKIVECISEDEFIQSFKNEGWEVTQPIYKYLDKEKQMPNATKTIEGKTIQLYYSYEGGMVYSTYSYSDRDNTYGQDSIISIIKHQLLFLN